MKRLTNKVILWFLSLLDYRFSSKTKFVASILLGLVLCLSFFFFISRTLFSRLSFGEKQVVTTQRDITRANTSVSAETNSTFADNLFELTTSQWVEKEGNLSKTQAESYLTLLANVEDAQSADRAYNRISWSKREVGEPLVEYTQKTAKDLTRLVTLKGIYHTYTAYDLERWVGYYDVSVTSKSELRSERTMLVELYTRGGKVTSWSILEGGFK